MFAHVSGPQEYHWVGLRENLQETMVFTIKYRAFLQIFTSSNSMRIACSSMLDLG